jgi:hypothetical protein
MGTLLVFLEENGKLLHILTPNQNYSKLLKPYSKHVVEMHLLRGSLEYKKTSISGQSNHNWPVIKEAGNPS